MAKLLIGFLLAASSSAFATSTTDVDSIRASLREHIPQFRYCFQQELDRELQGQ